MQKLRLEEKIVDPALSYAMLSFGEGTEDVMLCLNPIFPDTLIQASTTRFLPQRIKSMEWLRSLPNRLSTATSTWFPFLLRPS